MSRSFVPVRVIIALTLSLLTGTIACRTEAPPARARPPEAPAPAAQAARTRPIERRSRSLYPWLERSSGARTSGLNNTVHDRFPVPKGCTRLAFPRGSFADWVQHLPLKPASARVLDYRARRFETNLPVLAVVDIDVFPPGRDLQQCADYGVRLGVEYLARFHSGRRVRWRLQDGKAYAFAPTPANIERTLIHLFAYLGTFGLKAYYPAPARAAAYEPGDIVLGNITTAIGHAFVIQDALTCAGGEARYLVSQSWIPAQTPHIPDLREGGGDVYVTRERIEAVMRQWTGDTRVGVRVLPGVHH